MQEEVALNTHPPKLIIAGLVPAILFGGHEKDARDKPGHDEVEGNEVEGNGVKPSPSLERRHALARQFVGAFVVVVPGVALHPVP